MKAKPSLGSRLTFGLAAAAAAIFALTASECQTDTNFTQHASELICDDKVDNDEDGSADCLDSDCSNACVVSVGINVFPKPVTKDSLVLTGTQSNATSVVVSILPSGTVGSVVLGPGSWTANVTNLSALTTYTITATSSNGQGQGDTATVSFPRSN